MTSAIQIDFAAIAGTDSDRIPQGAADAALSKISTVQELEAFSCRASLDDANLASVREVARLQLDAIRKDPRQLSQLGKSSLDGVNRTVDRMIAEQGKLEIPEVERITKEMSKAVSKFRKKYKDSDPRTLQVLDQFANFLKGIVSAGGQFFEQLRIDSLSAVERLDRVAGKIEEHMGILDRNVRMSLELYNENEAAISQLIGVIAVMEQLLEDMQRDAETKRAELAAIPQNNSVARREKEEELTVVVEMIEKLDIRRSEYVQRLTLAWASAPQLRNLAKVSDSLHARLQLLVQITIPAMKQTIAMWGQILQAEEAGHVIAAVNAAHNDAVTEYAGAASKSIPALARLAQQPSTSPEAMLAMADSVVAQHQGILAAMEEGKRLRAELDDTAVKSFRIINDSTKNYTDTVVQLFTVAKRPLELEAAPALPEAILAYTGQQQPVAA